MFQNGDRVEYHGANDFFEGKKGVVTKIYPYIKGAVEVLFDKESKPFMCCVGNLTKVYNKKEM